MLLFELWEFMSKWYERNKQTNNWRNVKLFIIHKIQSRFKRMAIVTNNKWITIVCFERFFFCSKSVILRQFLLVREKLGRYAKTTLLSKSTEYLLYWMRIFSNWSNAVGRKTTTTKWPTLCVLNVHLISCPNNCCN